MKRKIAHQLVIVQDHVLQYEYYRVQGSKNTQIDTPDVWLETYNAESAAKMAILSESSTGDELPMDIEYVAEMQCPGDNNCKVILNQKRNPLILKRPFVPLFNKESNGEIIDGTKQFPTVYVTVIQTKTELFINDYLIGHPFVHYVSALKFLIGFQLNYLYLVQGNSYFNQWKL